MYWSQRIAGLGETVTLPMTLSINSQLQFVGDSPIYQLSNARPGAQIQWSSYKDGVDTKESFAAYESQVVGPNGSVQITGGAWTAANVGNWLKEALVQNEDGTWSKAVVAFRVVDPASVETPVVTGGQGGSFFQDTLFTAFGFNVTGTTVILALGGIWAAKALKLIK